MPLSRKHISTLRMVQGELRMIEHRRGQVPFVPTRHRDLEQRTKPDSKPDTKPDTKPGDKLFFRKYIVQPHFDERIEEDRERANARFRLYWRTSGQVKTEPVSEQTRLSHHPRLNTVREPGQASTQHESRTSEWLMRMTTGGTVVPKHLSRIEFPAGDVAEPTPPLPRTRRTNEDKANVEAVVITPISRLSEYVSTEMIDSIRTSPFHDPGEDVVIVRNHESRTRGQNIIKSFKLLTLLIRNVASEIVYREQRIAAEEKMYREQGAFDDPE